MVNELEQHASRIEALARSLGLDYYPVDFEVAPQGLMTEIAVYGLPVRMPHWSFGVRYIHQLVRQSMGHSKIFEVMFPGDPCRAFLMDTNSPAENSLFIAHDAPELEQWERDIFLMVRAESLYFYPVFACQIMNEGWASYWHARLMREADFLPQSLYLSALQAHSDVVRPFASGEQAALAVNPYHLGFTIWEDIVAEHGLDQAFEVQRDEDHFGFIRH